MNTTSQLSRRRFLRQASTAAAAGVALPTLIPSGVLAANGQPGANDRINLGVIGMGRRAGDLVREAARLTDARLMAFADLDLNRAKAEAAKNNNCFTCQDYRKLLERKDVDAIITATPEHWRSNICIHACQAGKDLYVEKPMTLTIREGRLMVEAARKYKRVFQVGSQQRSDWTDIAGCEFIRSGGLGKIKKVYVWNYPSPWECALPAQPIPDGLDWDFWCGPTEKVPYNKDLFTPRANPGWLSFRLYSGGEMTGWGAHGFDMIQYALGMDDSGPIEIWTEGPKFETVTYTQSESKKRGDETNNKPKVFFRYPGDIVMELVDKTPDGVKPPSFGGIVVGEKGTFTIDRGRISSDPEEIAIDILKKRPRGYNGSHIADWLRCIKSRKNPTGDAEIGHRSSTVCHLGNIARWTGRKLKWDPAKEIFPDDQDANAHLDRARRKPWELPKTV
ncbi:MAG: Gfo/Idh/MocA family oxidoreductase [Verrucomicrobia bacterium]|nr:Gfo/Idh/MocA family oxidoreductase [Verrucomicrobiota bacterium]